MAEVMRLRAAAHSEGIEVKDYVALEIPDNLAVAAQDPARLREIYKRLDLGNTDGLVLSACVQMQSLPSIRPSTRWNESWACRRFRPPSRRRGRC